MTFLSLDSMREKTKKKIWRIVISVVTLITILGMVAPLGVGFGF